ncbi:MAG: MaoC family dehydratase [Thermoprotei archaeon]
MRDATTRYEDLSVGRKFVSRVGRTLLDADNVWFSLLTLNSNQIHFNQEYTKVHLADKPFGGRLVVNGVLTLGIVIGLSVTASGVEGIMLGLEQVKFTHPVFSGDTIYAEAEVVEMRESSSRGGFGVVKFKTRGYNQRGETVVEFVRVVLVPKRENKRDGV